MQKYILIAVGGAFGSIARYWVATSISSRFAGKFPLGTFIVNITACVAIGFVLTYLNRRMNLSPAWRYAIPIGFLGGYSTFSAYEWETFSSLRSGAALMSVSYAAASLVLGLIAVWGGALLAEAIA